MDIQSCRYELTEGPGGSIRIDMEGGIGASNAVSMIEDLEGRLKDRMPCSLSIDLGKVAYLDDFGVLVLAQIRKLATSGKGEFNIVNASDEAGKTLSMFNFNALDKGPGSFERKRSPHMLVRLGEAGIRHCSDLKYMVSFAGSVLLSLIHVCVRPKSLRSDDTVLYMRQTGVDALPIVGLISFLLGLIMAFMSSIQLRQFGANIYVASLVSLAMARELGPIMTAIVVAGRSGSAFAAEIGTMKISEEVDALFTMGFDPTRFLVVPRIIASVVVVPLLTLFSDVFAILGGLAVGVFLLDLTPGSYMAQTMKTLDLFDVFWGFFKAAVFAFLIAWIACLRGFRVSGGAAAVGRATTSAVVSSIFLIILFDSIFAVILSYWE